MKEEILIKMSEKSDIAIGANYYHFSQIVYLLLIIAIISSIISLFTNIYFYFKNKEALSQLKGLNKIKTISFISAILLPLSIIGVIICLTIL